MSELQEEIKQSVPFKDKEQEVYLNLQRTAHFLKRDIEALLKKHELSSSQYNALRILRGAGEKGLACREVGSRMITFESDMTRLLDRLVDRGLVTRERSKEDARVKLSKITNEGLRILNALDGPIGEVSRKQLSHLGEEMLEELNALLVLARKRS